MVEEMRRLQTSVGGDILRLLAGAGVAQLIGLASMPILARIFSPEAFGLSALFAGVVAIIGVVACLSYEFSIPLPDSDLESANLLAVSCLSALLVSVLIALGLGFWKDALLSTVAFESLGPIAWLFPVGVFVTGISAALTYWNTRTRNFARASTARVVQSIITAATGLGLGLAGYVSAMSLILAAVGGQAASVALQGTLTLRDMDGPTKRRVDLTGIGGAAKRYRAFPFFYLLSNLTEQLSTQLPSILFVTFLSPAVAGFYALAATSLSLPSSLLGRAITPVLMQRATEARLRGSLAALFEQAFCVLLLVGFTPILGFGMLAPDIFPLLFGAEWTEAGYYAMILSPWLALAFVSSPLSILTAVLEVQKFSLAVSLVSVILRTLSLLAGVATGDVWLSLILFTGTGVLICLYKIFQLATFAGSGRLAILKTGLSQAFLVLMPLGLLWAITRLTTQPIERVAVFIPGAAVLFLYLLWTRVPREWVWRQAPECPASHRIS